MHLFCWHTWGLLIFCSLFGLFKNKQKALCCFFVCAVFTPVSLWCLSRSFINMLRTLIHLHTFESLWNSMKKNKICIPLIQVLKAVLTNQVLKLPNIPPGGQCLPPSGPQINRPFLEPRTGALRDGWGSNFHAAQWLSYSMWLPDKTVHIQINSDLFYWRDWINRHSMTFTGSDVSSVEHSRSNDHYHKQMVSSCWVRTVGCFTGTPHGSLQLNYSDCPVRTCRPTCHASLGPKPIRGLYEDAPTLLSKSQRSLLDSRSHSEVQALMPSAERKVWIYIVFAPACDRVLTLNSFPPSISNPRLV